MTIAYDSFDVEVPGGTLHVGRYGTGRNVVLAAHGITANHLSMKPLAATLGEDFTVIAPDLRGRGKSADITGPFGMRAHADDMAAVLDHLGIGDVLMLGHSMGGFVALVTAHRHPTRVRRIILVDGGLPLDLGPLNDLPGEQIVQAVIGPALERLRMTFPSLDAYLDFWRPHPALAEDWNAWIEEHYAYDLVGEAPELRSGVREDAVLRDGTDQLKESDVLDALAALEHPTTLVHVPRGLMNQVPPLYTDEAVAGWLEKLPTLRAVFVDDVNHYTVGLSERGAKALADVVREEAAT